MLLRIEARDLPGRVFGDRVGAHVAVQRRARPAELPDPRPGDAPAATWTLDRATRTTPAGRDLTGPYVQGGPGARFVHPSWGTVDAPGAFTMSRRAKLMLDAVDPATLAAAARSGLLTGRLGLTDDGGGPLCAAVRPPVVITSSGRRTARPVRACGSGDEDTPPGRWARAAGTAASVFPPAPGGGTATSGGPGPLSHLP
ncbi:DUF5990 family protein [Streptomyces sp. NPDC001070]